MEKLFVQIFESKDWITQQLQQHADSYKQQLASRLLIDGITPPPWLLNPNSSYPNELEKEEIISKLLLRPSRGSVSYSRGDFSQYYRPVVAGGNGQLPNEVCMETYAPNEAVHVSNEPMTAVECPNNDIGCNLNCVVEQDNIMNSPQNEADARLSSINATLDTSLARIQRSKSRQKARELRTNGKTTAKSCLSNENQTCVSIRGNSPSKVELNQVTQEKCPSEVGKCNDISRATSMEVEGKGGKGNDTTSHSGRLLKSSSSNENSSFLNDHAKKSSSSIKEVLDGCILVQPTGDSLQQSGHVNGAMKEGKLPEVCSGNYASKTSTSEKTQDTQRQIKPSVGRVTRSRSSSQQTSGINKSLERGTSASCSPKEGGGPPPAVGHLMHELNASSKLLDAVKNSQALSGRTGETQAVCNSEGVHKPVNSANITAVPVTKSTSGCVKESQLGANHQENAETVVGNGNIEAPGIMQPISSCIKLDAFKISQVLSDRIEETQVVCNSEGVHKQVISSNIVAPRVTRSKSGSMKESQLGVNHQEKAEIVVGNGPTEVADVMQPVSSGIKLDPITLCTESEGLASLQASDCCMIFKPKQLNFDDIDECALDEICSPLSKKRKLDGLLGQECCPSKESASSIDHRSGSTLFEPQLPNANFLCSSRKAGRTDSRNNIKESTTDETMSNGLDNEKTVEEDAEHNSFVHDDDFDVICEINTSSKEISNIFEEEKHSEKSHLNEDHASLSKMQIEEGDLGHKGEGSTIGVYMPVSKSPESSFMTKQENKDSEDPSSSKSKEFEAGTNPLLPIVKLNSGKVNTWPLNHQGDIEDRPYCYSDSQGFRVHIHRDAIHCDLKTPENNLHSVTESAQVLSSEEIHVSQSESIQRCDKIIHDGMTYDLPEGTKSLHELQAAEETVTKVDVEITEMDNVLKQSEPASVLKLIKTAGDDSAYSLSADVEPANPTSFIDVAVTDNKDDNPEWVSSSGSDRLSQNDDKIVIVSNDFNYSLAAGMGPEVPINIDDFRDYMNCEISLSEWVASYGSARSLKNDDKSVIASDESMPVYEGFIIDEEVENVSMENAEGGLDFHMLEVPSTTIARASIVEQICRSASMQTPLSHFSSTLKENEVQNYYGFMTDGILEQMDLGSSGSRDEDCTKRLQKSECDITEIDSSLQNQQKFDSYPFTSTPFSWQSKNHYSSPLGKLWDRSASSSGSSEKQLSSNPELTCFPIEEDPGSNEESENAEDLSDELEENGRSKVENEPVEREPPAESTETCFQPSVRISTEIVTEGRENDDEEVAVDKEPPAEATEVCPQHANPLSTSMKHRDRCGSNSVNIEASVPRTRDMAKYKPKNHPGIKISRYEEDNRGSSMATRASSRGNVSAYSKNKSSMRNGMPRISQKEAKSNNIVSNITSFIPIVQQKQAAAVCTGKRDIKVKALEVAEAAKRREQEKENERKVKKEALKLERERIGKENAREMEMNKKKKQEELKKKEADLAARKRQREEDEKKHLAKKRKLVTEAQKNQKLPYEKPRAGKVELEKQQAKNAAIAGNKKGSDNLRQNKNTDVNSVQSGLRTEKTLASVILHVVSAPENYDASIDLGEKEKATSVHEMSPVKPGIVKSTGQEISYDISPYQCSDDEDEDEEDLPTKKFVPSWASRNRVTMALPLQQNIVPETIFPVESFCHMDEVLLPRRLQAQ